MACCLFYCPLAFQRDPKPFKRVIVFRVSSPKKEQRLNTPFWTDSRSKQKKKTLEACQPPQFLRRIIVQDQALPFKCI